MSSPQISYFYNPLFPTFYFGLHHPMKPFRAAMVHELILAYGLDSCMNYYQPKEAAFQDMALFHTPDYLRFLKNITPEAVQKFQNMAKRFNLTDDCPVFSGLYDYCTMTAGASMTACAHLNYGLADISVNYMGGYHHAKLAEASGFCYVNDIVLGIIELLKYHQRVMYIDIDVHAGDGVEEAFYTTNRVLTISFHKFAKDFFPGTGHIYDIGAEQGKGYAINVPLDDAIDDDMYLHLFTQVIDSAMESYHPNAVVLQTGADSLAGDRLGCFNLTLRGHGDCVRHVQHWQRVMGFPLCVVGGGGYTARSAAKCWAYEVGILSRQLLSEQLPANPYYEYYGPDYSLVVPRINMENRNKPEDVERKLSIIRENIRLIAPVNASGGSTLAPDLQGDTDSYEADKALYAGKGNDYYGGKLHIEDIRGLGKHEGEGVSEGERQRLRRAPIPQVGVNIDVTGTAAFGMEMEENERAEEVRTQVESRRQAQQAAASAKKLVQRMGGTVL